MSTPSSPSQRRRALRRGLRWALGAGAGGLAACSASRPRVPVPVAHATLQGPAGGRFETVAAFPSAHATPRRVTVWLPPGYDGRRSHALLVMHDGQNLFDPADAFGGQSWAVDAALRRLQATGAVRPTVVAAVWNTPLRWLEYVPTPALQDLPPAVREQLRGDRPDTGGPGAVPRSDAYLAFLASELVPWLRSRYSLDADPVSTVVMGSSMGGLVSLYGWMRHPEVFGAAGCISTHWPISVHPAWLRRADGTPDADAIERGAIPWLTWVGAQLRAPVPGQRLYFDHGTLNLDALYAPLQARMDALLRERGWMAAGQARSRVFPGADHDEASWRARLDGPLAFLLPPPR